MFKGSLVALITPFRNHELEEAAFQEHVGWQIDQGTHGLVPCGTTGESPALADDEQKRLVALCVFFFNDTATTEIYTLSLHDALPILTVTIVIWGRPGQCALSPGCLGIVTCTSVN